MTCDLCKEDSDRMIHVASWQVCQWCVSNNVLEHALEVESDVAKLKVAVAEASATHERDVRNETVSKTKFDLAYTAFEELTAAMNDLSRSTAASKKSLRIEVDAKDALQALRPAHRHVARGFRLVRVTDLIGSLPLAPHTPMRRRHRSAQLAVRGEHSMKSCQVHARWRHQCGKARHQVQRVEHDVRGAVPVWGLELVAHLPMAGAEIGTAAQLRER